MDEIRLSIAPIMSGDGLRLFARFSAERSWHLKDVVAYKTGFGMPHAEIGSPVTSIPLFLGPPVGILIHLVTLRGFWLRKGRRAGAPA